MTQPDGTPPHATCTADADGRVVFELTPPDPDAPARLLLRPRPRKGAPEPDGRTLTLEPAPGGRSRAVLEPLPALDEGRWDVLLLRAPGAAPERLRSGPRDLRALVEGHLRDRTAPVAVRIPYATKDGHLAVRAWLRTAHAETGRIDVGDDATTVAARLHGAAFTAAGLVRLTPRGGRDGELTVRPTVDKDRRGFRFTVRHAELAGPEAPDGPRYWDVSVLPAEDAPAVRAGRLLDDVADRKHSFVLPAARAGAAELRPYYTVDNDLSFEVTAAG